MLNTILLKSALKVINSPAHAQYTVTAHFISAAPNSTFSFYPMLIDDIIFDMNYADNFADEIDLNMTVSPKDYALMQDQGQDLRCIVTITYCTKDGRQVFDPPPIQRQYVVMINDPVDIRNTLPDVQSYTEIQTPMSVRLVEETIYALRHTKINTVYQKMDVKQAIHAITQSFDIERIHLVEPDNTHVYDHIDIGSYQGISSIYGYLQSKCGIYQKGINAYFTNGVLYIYPPFETDPVYDKSVIFYQVDTGRFAGSHVFHKSEKDSVSIVLNTQGETIDLTISGAENVGTGFIFNRASRMTDGFTAIDSQQGAMFTEDPALSITLNDSRTVTGGRNNLFHVHGTDNPYPHMSTLMAYQASLMTVQWMNCDPFLLDPCQKVKFYYDKNKVMMARTGIMERAYYRLARMEKMHSKYVFGCVGLLTLRLSPNETSVY